MPRNQLSAEALTEIDALDVVANETVKIRILEEEE